MTNQKQCISVSTVPIATKLGKMMIKWLLTIMSHDPSTCVPGKSGINKGHISTSKVYMAIKPSRLVTYLEIILPKKSVGSWVPRSFEITQRIKIILSLLPQCLSPRTETCQNVGFSWGIPSHKLTRPINYMALQNHVTKQNQYILFITMPMAAKLHSLVTYLKMFLTIELH